MDSPVATSGVMLLTTVKIVLNTLGEIVHVLSDQEPVHHHLLGIITAAYESANPEAFITPLFYANDRLWDGEQCEGTCCSGTMSPPWFSVWLFSHTTDRIEVRFCADEITSNENVLIELLEIYVQ